VPGIHREVREVREERQRQVNRSERSAVFARATIPVVPNVAGSVRIPFCC
jgi:hypothetical protein